MTKITAIKCPKCRDIIFSRARHDFHWCSCGEIAVDGGFDYLKVSYKTASPERIAIEVKETKKELYDDWNFTKDKFGLIKEKVAKDDKTS
jgi:ssDNA-binding Zn-finger/Zn-ribbon topoisomerase 1